MLSNTVLVALVLILITTSLILIIRKENGTLLVSSGKSATKNKEPTIIIAGPCSAGKTSFYSLLSTGEHKNTVMSQQFNVTHDFKLSKATSFRLMEFPGHNKLRNQLIDTLKASTNIKGLVFMVDSTIDPKDLTGTAEFLFQILQITERQPDGCDILLACNKSESFTSRPPLKIKETLEKELDKIMARKKKSLDTVKSTVSGKNSKNSGLTDGDDNESEQDDQEALLELQLSGDFKFSALEGNVDALEGSVAKNCIDKWECWIEERVIN